MIAPGPVDSLVSREPKGKEPVRRESLAHLLADPIPPSPVRAKPRASRNLSLSAAPSLENVALATQSILLSAVKEPPAILPPAAPRSSYWQQLKEGIWGGAARIVGGISEEDRRFLISATGDLTILDEIQKICRFLPRAPSEQAQSLQDHLVARIFINIAKYVCVDNAEVMGTERLIQEMLHHIPLSIRAVFERVEMKAEEEERFVQKEDFEGEGQWFIKTYLADLGTLGNSLLKSLIFDADQTLYDIYIAIHYKAVTPQAPSYDPEWIALARHLVYLALKGVKTSYPVLESLIDRWGSSVEPLLIDLMCSRLSAFKERHNVNSFLELACLIASELENAEDQLAPKIYELFFNHLEDEKRLPKVFRKPLAEWLKKTYLPKVVEKHQHHLVNFIKAVNEEKKILNEDPRKFEAVLDGVRALVDRYYLKMVRALPHAWQPLMQPGYGKQLVFEVLLQILRHYSATVSAPLSSLEDVIHYGLNQIEIILQTGDQHEKDPALRRKHFHVQSKNLLKKFCPGVHIFSDKPSLLMVNYCERYWKLTTQGPVLPLTERLYALFPDSTSTVDSFLLTYNQVIQGLMEAARPSLPIQISPFLFVKGYNMVHKFLLEGLVRFLERENRNKKGLKLLEAAFVNQVSALIDALPPEEGIDNSESWVPFCQILLQDISPMFSHKEDLACHILPSLIAVKHGAKVRSWVLSLAPDIQIIRINPLRCLGVEASLAPLMNNLAQKASAQLPEWDPLFAKLFVHKILAHLVAKYAAFHFNLDEPIPYPQFLNRLTLHFLNGFVEGYQESGSFVAPLEQLFHSLAPSLADLALPINDYLAPFRLPINDEEATRQRLRTILWDPKSPGVPGRLLSEFIGLETTVDQFYDLADSFATLVVPFIENYFMLQDNLVEALQPYFSEEVIQHSLHPLCVGLLESHHPHMERGKEIFRIQIRRLVFKIIVTAMEKEDKPSQPKEQIPFAIINRILRILRDHAPPLPDHKHKHSGALPPLTKADMLPLVHELLQYFITDPLKEVPLPHGFDLKIVNKIKDDLLPELCLKWYQKGILFINEVPENRLRLNTIFAANHVSVLAKVLGVWVQGFVVHLLSEKAPDIASKAVEGANKALRADWDQDVAHLIDVTITKLCESIEPDSPMHSLSLFVGRYAEAFFLKLGVPLFSHLKEVNDDLEEHENGTIILAIIRRLVPIISQYYQRINDIKLLIGETHAYRIPHNSLKSGLQGTLWDPPKANILNGGYPISMPIDPHRTSEEVRNDHRLVFFTVLSRHLLYFAGITPQRPFPVPDPFVKKGHALLAEVILPQTLLSLEKIVLSEENKDRLFLRLFEQLKNMAEKLEAKKSEDSPPPSPPSESQRKIFRTVGQLIKELLTLIPNPYLAPILYIEVLKEAAEEKLGSIFFEQFSDLDFIQVIRNSIVAGLPKIVPGKVEGVNKIDLKPFEEGTFLEADFDRPSITPEELEALKKEILQKGAEALMRGFERLVVHRNLEALRQNLGAQLAAMLEAKSGKSLASFVEFFKQVCNVFIQFFISVLGALLNIPYQVIRWPVKEWYLKRLVADYLEELDSSYHEGVVLDIVEDFFGQFLVPAAEPSPVA